MEKILIVDDEDSILEPLEEMLKGEGYRVRAFNNPIKALELLQTQEFDMAIFDIKMPEMNGYELLQASRAIRPGLPVIFLSSKQEEQDQIIGFTLGADDFVGKPFSNICSGGGWDYSLSCRDMFSAAGIWIPSEKLVAFR